MHEQLLHYQLPVAELVYVAWITAVLAVVLWWIFLWREMR